MKPDVVTAIEELRQAFPKATVTVSEDSDGGAHITMDPVDPGPAFAQRETWLKFHITFQYPYSDVYPHFVRPDLARADDAGLGEGFSATNASDGTPALQVSRRSNRLNPATDTASLKLIKVLQWMESR